MILSPLLYASSKVMSAYFTAVGILFRVGRIYSIHPCAFQDHFCIDLHTTQGCSGIRGEKGVPGSEGEYQAIAFLE